MRRLLALLVIPALALAPAACRPSAKGAVKVVVIGGDPRLADPAQGPLAAPTAVLLQNVAQGLVRFDAVGNIVPGLAERWNVSDDGLSYIFRVAAADWPDGRKVTAQQVARLLKRQLAARSKNPLKDPLGAVEDVVAMTDRVIEIRLIAPRPNLLPLLAQPEFAILRDGRLGTGPFAARPASDGHGVRLTREITSGDEESARREDVLLAGGKADSAVADFIAGKSALVLGGTFADLPLAQRARAPRGSLQFDPASGLFGLVPLKSGGGLDDPELRHLLSQAINRDRLVAAFAVPNLAPRVTLLEPGLDGMPAPVTPAWTGTPLGDRLPALRAQADRMFGAVNKPTIHLALPEGPGAELLLRALVLDWGTLGFKVERAASPDSADFAIVDEVAPSSSAAWFVRRFRCGAAPVCNSDMNELLESARSTPIPAQRYALLAQAAGMIEERQLFIPITAPIRWSLVSRRIQGFAGNRFARHTLTGLEDKPGSGD
ncbi:ABC transporter substrate-binding protein [Sphingomonas sp. URHD0057]|uniref:ABC transporter substrate-binding protein n=1 Tax=Sphingomonas sp. URHD0057 TaxID=1380389 RepID=UPI000569FB8D|nr:ABC transporter substrate-binding protein [Sphingomonas sp. URHD0057]